MTGSWKVSRSTWSIVKRGLDICASVCGLLLLAPVFAIVAVLIKIDSPGSVFFRQERMGKGFRPFTIYKFRTMVSDAPLRGGTVTTSCDPRITRLGAILRETKIDEFPQLINVLKGEMSLVGPRPEVPKYVDMFWTQYATVLSVRPGITDLASLKYRHESAILSRSANPEELYVRHIMPDKLRLAEEYVRRSSLGLDLMLIFHTLLKLVPNKEKGKINMDTTASIRPYIDTVVRMAADVIMVNIALAIAMMTRYFVVIWVEGSLSPHDVLLEYVGQFVHSFWILTIISVVVFYISGFYNRGRYYQGQYKALVVAQAVSLSYLTFGFVAMLFHSAVALPRSVFFIGWGVTAGLLVVSRLWSMLWRMMEGTTVPRDRRRSVRIELKGKKKILVIGGAGYIGSALLPKLLARGHHVRLLDLFMFGKEPIVNVIGHPHLQIVQADLRHVDKIVQGMKGMDEVIHLGAIVGDPACSLDQELTVEVNLMAVRMIAEVAKGSGIKRFCFASTCSVYGASDEILDERSHLNPLSLYARSKLASEKVLMQMADEVFSPVVLRFGTVYGLSGRTRFDLVINLLTAKAIKEGKITVFGGEQWRPFLHVNDAALALLKVVESPTDLIHGQVYNVGSNEQNYQLGDAAQIIQSFVPQAQVVDMGADTDFRNYRVDFSKIKKMLSFTPEWTLEQGIKQVIAAFENGDVQDYRSPLYSNVKFLVEEANSRLIRREKGWAHELIKEEAKPANGSNGSVVGAAR